MISGSHLLADLDHCLLGRPLAGGQRGFGGPGGDGRLLDGAAVVDDVHDRLAPHRGVEGGPIAAKIRQLYRLKSVIKKVRLLTALKGVTLNEAFFTNFIIENYLAVGGCCGVLIGDSRGGSDGGPCNNLIT